MWSEGEDEGNGPTPTKNFRCSTEIPFAMIISIGSIAMDAFVHLASKVGKLANRSSLVLDTIATLLIRTEIPPGRGIRVAIPF
jgi:hypothetical protein